MGMHSKMKGKAGEREVVKLFRDAFEGVCGVDDIGRNHQQAEKGGSDLVGVPYYSVEVKRFKVISWGKGLDDWWEQCVRQAEEEGKAPCLVFRQDRGQWFVMVWAFLTVGENSYKAILRWSDFAKFIKGNFSV